MALTERSVNVFLTGATGLIGRHILYELLNLYAQGIILGGIHLLLRNTRLQCARERVDCIIEHPFIPEYLRHFDRRYLLSFIHPLEGDLTSPGLAKSLGQLKNDGLYVIHSAASTNLFPTIQAEREVYENNYVGTLNFLKSIGNKARKFVYVSTVFSVGKQGGLIGDEFLAFPRQTFRNPYEKYKAVVEEKIADYCTVEGLDWQILRPGVVCGRLMDGPLYYTSKFDVFYGWGKFFYKYKANNKDGIRIFVNKDSGVSILPVDYVAKAIVRAFLYNIKELNIVHPFCIPHTVYLSEILKQIGFDNYQFTDKAPSDKTKMEDAYYRTAGKAMTPYFLSPNHHYDTAMLGKIMEGIKDPMVTANIGNLLSFAITHGFQSLS